MMVSMKPLLSHIRLVNEIGKAVFCGCDFIPKACIIRHDLFVLGANFPHF